MLQISGREVLPRSTLEFLNHGFLVMRFPDAQAPVDAPTVTGSGLVGPQGQTVDVIVTGNAVTALSLGTRD